MAKTVNNFQSMSSMQGSLWHRNCVQGLELAGFDVTEKKVTIAQVGVEFDAIAVNRWGVRFFFEFKGSMQGKRPGSIRTDTLRKAIANGYLFTLTPEYQTSPPLVLLTSHIPTRGAGKSMLYSLERDIFFDVLNPWQNHERLKWLAEADPEEIEIDMGTPLTELLRIHWCL